MVQVAIAERPLVRPAAVAEDVLRRLAYSDPDRFPVLFDSAARGPLSRYSILAAYPQAALWQDGGGRLHASGMLQPAAGGFLAALETSIKRDRRGEPGGADASGGAGAAGAAARGGAGPGRGGGVGGVGDEQGAQIQPPRL
jgi:hypothetical protein